MGISASPAKPVPASTKAGLQDKAVPEPEDKPFPESEEKPVPESEDKRVPESAVLWLEPESTSDEPGPASALLRTT
jgi:hypothetical protein